MRKDDAIRGWESESPSTPSLLPASTRRKLNCYLLLLPTALLVGLFCYYPAISSVYYSLFDWDGAARSDFTGLSNYFEAFRDPNLIWGFAVILILIAANVVKMIPSIAIALAIFHLRSERGQYVYRILFVIPMIIPAVVMTLLWKFLYEPNTGAINGILAALDLIDPAAPPLWLSSPYLVLPSVIFMGFPWVGAVSVLIFLSGLNNIPSAIFETAEMDGCGPIERIFAIELPLIFSQVRLNMVLMIVATLASFEQILLLCNEYGGPDGMANVPGLYIFRLAFLEGRAGYACAVGLMLFLVVMALTLLNERFVRWAR